MHKVVTNVSLQYDMVIYLLYLFNLKVDHIILLYFDYLRTENTLIFTSNFNQGWQFLITKTGMQYF